MFPTFCGAMGFAGWLIMLLVWTGLIALVVWSITRLFPDQPPPGRTRGSGRLVRGAEGPQAQAVGHDEH